MILRLRVVLGDGPSLMVLRLRVVLGDIRYGGTCKSKILISATEYTRVGAPYWAKLGWNWVDWAGKLFRPPAEPGSKNKWPFTGDFALVSF